MELPASRLPLIPGCPSADLRADLEMLELDLGQQPVHGRRIEQPGAEVLDRFGAARDPVAQALRRRPAKVAGGDVAGQERVARADRRALLLLVDPNPEERVAAALEHVRV